MLGRIKRKRVLEATAQRAVRMAEMAADTALGRCALCLRPLGSRVEWHHTVPRSEGGEETVPVHPICHRAIHAHVSNHDLARDYADLDVLRAREDIGRFLDWIGDKPPNFSAPTRRRRME